MATRGASNFATKDDLKSAVTQLGHELKVFREEVKGDLRALGVMVEQTNAHVRALAEGLVSTRDELTRKMSTSKSASRRASPRWKVRCAPTPRTSAPIPRACARSASRSRSCGCGSTSAICSSNSSRSASPPPRSASASRAEPAAPLAGAR